MALIDPSLAGIIVAGIAAVGTILAARQSRQNAKDIKPIKEVLANSPGATSLDGVIRILQNELNNTSKRHEAEIHYQNIQIEELRTALLHCQGERSQLALDFESMQQQLRKHEKQLNGNT